jgi:hypothetical protein
VTIEDQIVALFANANPVPSLALLDPIEPLDMESLTDPSERSREMTEVQTLDSGDDVRRRSKKPGLLVAAIAAVVVALGIGVLVASPGPQIPATPLNRAAVFWVAMANGDRDTALAQLEPGATAVGGANTFGWAHTLEEQFDWYEVVGFRWAFDQCIETTEGEIECSASGRNDWSDALGVEPITGTFVMEIGPGGITEITEKDESFVRQWSPLVLEVFNDWVETNHPADAAVMWGEDDPDVSPEILDLFALNTERFVQAQSNG